MNIDLAPIITGPRPTKWKINQFTDWNQFNLAMSLSPVINLPPTRCQTTTAYYSKWLNEVHSIADATIGKYQNKEAKQTVLKVIS